MHRVLLSVLLCHTWHDGLMLVVSCCMLMSSWLLSAFVQVHEFAGRLALTRKNIMLRDHHRCQYCGSTKELTLDHIKPVCR